MKRIGLISDTHSFLDDLTLEYLKQCDEIWHAGDIGNYSVIEALDGEKLTRVVYGNIDDAKMRREFPKDQIWKCEGVKVYMTHIGGYPGRYNKRVAEIISKEKPNLFICGHSHILKVLPDHHYDMLHMNPGACGHHGFHQIRTLLRFSITKGKIHDLEAVELGRRGRS